MLHCMELRAGKGGILFPKRIPPFDPPEKGEGSPPSTPALAVGRLKSCAACGIGCLLFFVSIRFDFLLSSLLRSRWQLCCLTDAAHPLRVPLCLRFVTLPQFPSTTDLYKLAFACQGGIAALSAVGTIENARISDRRKLVCTKTQYAERQRLIEAEASHMSTHPMAASEAMPPRRDYLCPARAVLRA